MSDVAIAGAGMTRFTRQAERGHDGLLRDAFVSAVEHAGIGFRDVDAVFCGTVWGGVGVAQKGLKDLPMRGIPMTNLENACASSSSALREAYAWIKAGLCDVAVACGVEVMSNEPKGPLRIEKGKWMFDAGLTLPGWYALHARRHMTRYGLTDIEMAAVAVKSRKMGALNPLAHFRSETTLEEVLGSRAISDPITLLQCCPKTDGASAVVVASDAAVKRLGLNAVWLRASAMGSGEHVFSDPPMAIDTPTRVSRQALEQAGVGPHDLDVVEVHDAFTIGEILYTEALGLCAPGEGGRYAMSGRSLPNGGGVAVNTSGGLLSRGHPLGASGMAQMCEIVWQLRGEAGPRQVENARLGVTFTNGANEFELDANVCSVFVVERRN